MKNLKKILSLTIGLVMILAGILVYLDYNRLSVGAGSGEDCSVGSLQEMGELLRTAIGEEGSTAPVAMAEQETEGKKAVASTTYSSYTMLVESDAKQSTSAHVTLNDYTATYKSKTNFKRSMKVCFTEDAVYYRLIYEETGSRSEGGYEGNSTGEVDSSGYVCSWDVEIYVGQRVLVKFNKTTSYGNSAWTDELTKYSKHLGEWIELAADDSDFIEIQDITDDWREGLQLCGKYIENDPQKDFEGNGKKFTLADRQYYKLVSEWLAIEGYSGFSESELAENCNGFFNVDLHDESRPELFWAFSQSESNSESGIKSGFDYSLYQKYTFSNINNTVIQSLDDLKVIPATEL